MPSREPSLGAVTTMSCRAFRRLAMRSGMVLTPSRFQIGASGPAVTVIVALHDDQVSTGVPSPQDGAQAPLPRRRKTELRRIA
jgi:hypothetical protein